MSSFLLTHIMTIIPIKSGNLDLFSAQFETSVIKAGVKGASVVKGSSCILFPFPSTFQIAAYKSQGKNPPSQLTDAMKAYQQKIHFAQTKLKEGGRNAVQGEIISFVFFSLFFRVVGIFRIFSFLLHSFRRDPSLSTRYVPAWDLNSLLRT